MLDFDNQFQVEKSKNNERGVEIVTPFYTHLDKNGQPCGILVNRGWMPWDLKDMRQDRIVDRTKVRGVLYTGDAKTKYSKENEPSKAWFRAVYPEEMAVLSRFPNEEAGTVMLKAVDFDTDAPTPLPDVDSPEALTKFTISPERHDAYAHMWESLTYFGVLANTAIWLYL